MKRKRKAPAQASAPAPAHVAILGLGPSVGAFLELTKRNGGRRQFCDEVWGINALGDVFACDRVFHMDDVRIQEIRAAARPDSNIAAMLKWLKGYRGIVYTSRAHPDYPCLVDFPLEDVANSTGQAYLNNTAAYAVAYAVHIGVQKLSVFGCDYTYPNAHHAEKGRGCMEFWLGIAAARGIKLAVPRQSSLMDGCVAADERYYGYDCVDVSMTRHANGKVTVGFNERAKPLPTADEIEHRYDHNRHPSPLVDGTRRST